MMKLIKILLITFFCLGMFFSPIHAQEQKCKFSGDIREDFEKCNPEIGIRVIPNVDMKVDKKNSDFRTIVTEIVERVQKTAAVVAIGLLIWIGLILAFPSKTESKEGAKSKVTSVLVGFLIVVGTTLIVNWIIKLTYEFFP